MSNSTHLKTAEVPQGIDLYRRQKTPWQQKVLDEWKWGRYKILAIGRKGRKTTFDINELMRDAIYDERELTYPFIGPTRTQAKKIVWEDHIENVIRICDKVGISYKRNYSELSVRFPGYGKIMVEGADNIEALRGKSDWGGVVMDEFTTWKNKRYAWEEVIEPNLVVHNAWTIISGTPGGYDYFHLLMKMGDHGNIIEGDAFDDEQRLVVPNSLFQSYRFTSYDNPYIDHSWIDNRKDRLTKAAFNQEYLARFEKFTGLIYKDFSRETHVIEPFKIPVGWERYAGMDFGATNPTAYLWIALDRDSNIYVYDEHYQSQMTTKSHANIIKVKTGAIPISTTYCDPSGEQQILDYAAQQIFLTPAVKIYTPGKSWVMSGIDKVTELLKVNHITKKPRLFIFRNCINTIREFETYRWEEKKLAGADDDNEKEHPKKANDHTMDALRYFVISHFLSDTFTEKTVIK